LSDEPQPPAQITDRVLGTFNSYTGMIVCLRARAKELRIPVTSPDVARVTGLADAYVAKVLAPSQRSPRRLGMLSLQPVLSVLGCKLVLVEDKGTLEKYTSRVQKRDDSRAHDGAITLLFSRLHMRKIGRIGAQVRWAAARRRSAQASNAARARWQKVRAQKAVEAQAARAAAKAEAA